MHLWDVSDSHCFDASVYPVVTILQKNIIKNVYEFPVKTKTGKEIIYSSETFNTLPENILGFLLSDKFELVKKITKKSKKLTDFCLINATSTAGEADKFHDYIEKEYDTTKTLIRIINTGTIDPYVCLWGERRFIDKGENLITPYLLNNETVLGKNRYKMYNSIKIVFAKMANKTEAFLDEEGCYASINTNCLHTFKNISPKYVLGWIHSFVFNFIYGVLFDGLRMAGGYLPYSAPYLSCMVIPTATEEQQQEIIVLVDKILAAKKQDSSANTKEWEKQIDQKVYKLYGLTTEEIAIVEGK